MRVVIVDDEELARARLRRLLGAHEDVEVVAELGDARRAASELGVLAPDVLLLDIRMPQRDGFDVAAALDGRPCAVVFVTAWSDHAVRAFDTGAVDYLLKPVDGERLALALDRARERLRPTREGAPAPSAADEARASRMAVRDRGRLVFVAVADIDAVVARGNYVELRARGRTYTLRATLSALEARLDPVTFVRVHRSVILRVERISAIEPLFRGEYLVTLADGSTFTSARGHRADLRRALGLE
ncbi:MAG TPA: LytTR family DNA-binding domain-containing protein [Kofleriaceae bacterium]|nr:LytTR family DNA-binding domain-containing protein [Kofleriaceae bacterium]